MIPSRDLVDLASERVGGTAVAASDEFFAPKENLLVTAPPIFLPDKYTDAGKWMDGWESRRKRTAGHDWCVVKLGLPGTLHGVDIDTSFFTGNFPSHASIDASAGGAEWAPILSKVRLQGGAGNVFDVDHPGRFTHVRLNIFPDGGVARLRVYGVVIPDFSSLAEPADYASVVNGGQALVCSDMYFGSRHHLIMPGRPKNMGGGWETKRRRGPGYDWIIVKLGTRCHIESIAVETEHFKGNYPDRCSIETCDAAQPTLEELTTGTVEWQQVLPETKLSADAVHTYPIEVGAATHVRLKILPDGGVSRLRVFGRAARGA